MTALSGETALVAVVIKLYVIASYPGSATSTMLACDAKKFSVYIKSALEKRDIIVLFAFFGGWSLACSIIANVPDIGENVEPCISPHIKYDQVIQRVEDQYKT